MSISTALRRARIRPSNQTLADLSLCLDQERRALLKRLDEIDSEIAALTDMVH